MGQAAAKELSPLMEETLKGRLKELDQSLLNAKRVLNETMGDKYMKLVLFCIIGCCLFGLTGFGVGYAYSKKHTYAFPNNFMETYRLGLGVQMNGIERRLQEQEQIKNKGKPRK